MNENKGVIYILTNPSFPLYVKIGYADDLESRLKQLNRSECIPFAFRAYAYYKVPTRLTDLKLHSMIDKLNPNLRTIEEFEGKKRVREFYSMKPEDAYSILEAIAEINGRLDDLFLCEPTKVQIASEQEAEEIEFKGKLPKLEWMIARKLISVGDEVYILNRPNEIATIVDNENVKYKDKIMSLNQFGKTITGWQTIQTYSMTKHVKSNKTLSDLRYEKMCELRMIKE